MKEAVISMPGSFSYLRDNMNLQLARHSYSLHNLLEDLRLSDYRTWCVVTRENLLASITCNLRLAKFHCM